jgi:predicted DNA-binding transcriptional regulator AlpA
MNEKPLADVPSLDSLLADPRKAATLPPDVARSYLIALASLQPVLLLQSERGAKISLPDDPLIGVDAVAHLIGMSVSWVEKHPDALPVRRSVEGNPRWLKSEVIAWVKSRPLYGRAT